MISHISNFSWDNDTTMHRSNTRDMGRRIYQKDTHDMKMKQDDKIKETKDMMEQLLCMLCATAIPVISCYSKIYRARKRVFKYFIVYFHCG